MKLILASASERRAGILRDAGIPFMVMSSAVDETPSPGESPHDLVQRLAAAKAELVAARAVGPAIVIAADTIVTLEGHIFGKPRSSDDARHMLEKLSGLTHAVVTGVALIRLPDAERLTFVESTLVHFAAHSIVDDRDPQRSGIWLSPSPGRRGLLQAADIVKLGFDGRLVVLATCSSNGGPFLRGEGVMSLAHAFFQARARTVVASLWPQIDTDAEALVTGFYRYLSQGASVAAALRLAQLELLRKDPRLPVAAWAGMAVLGDGDLVPFPGGRHSWAVWWLAVAGASLLSLVTAFAVRARRALHCRS